MPVAASSSRMSLQPAGLAIDEILAFAAAINAARNVHLVGVDRQAAVGVFERERHLAGAHAAAGLGSR